MEQNTSYRLNQANYRLCASMDDSQGILNSFVDKFDLVAVGGLPLVGKTKLISGLKKKPDINYLIWNSSDILTGISSKLDFDSKIYQYLNEFQFRTFKTRFFDTNSKFIVEGWMSSESNRRKILDCNPALRSCLILVDMPDELIYDNYIQGYLGTFALSDFKLELKKRRQRFMWPKINEGWNAIAYLCPNLDGEDHLRRTVSGFLYT